MGTVEGMKAAEIKAGFRDFLNNKWNSRIGMEQTPEGLAVREERHGLIPVAGTDAEWEEYWRSCARDDSHPFSLMAVHMDEAVAIIEFREYHHPGIVVRRGGFHAAQYIAPSQQAAKIKREFCAYVNESWFLRECGIAPGKEDGALIEAQQEIWVAGTCSVPLVGRVADWIACAERYSGTEHSEYLLMLMALDELLDEWEARGEMPRQIAVGGEGFSVPARNPGF